MSFEGSSSSADGDGINYSGYFVTDQIFESFIDACNWCKQVAMNHRFELVVASYKPFRDGRKAAYLRCNRGLPYRGKDDENDFDSRPKTLTKCCDCQFRVKVVENVDFMFGVRVDPKFGLHNHSMVVYGEGNRQIGQLSPPMKAKIRVMAGNHVAPSNILYGLKQEFPQSTPNIRQIYNQTAKIHRESFDGRSEVQQFAHMANEHKYYSVVESVDGTGALTHVFAAHPESVQLLRTYPHVIIMDSTYKTNRYSMPMFEMVGVTPTNQNFLIGWVLMMDETEYSYKWALTVLRNLIGDPSYPCAIITDRELGLLNAIGQIFPNTPHLLCSWHIRRDVNIKVFKLTGRNQQEANRFEKGVWQKVMVARTLDEYDNAVATMVSVCSDMPAVLDYVQKTWLVYKEKFVRCWTNQFLTFGNSTTNRVESQHASMKKWLNSSRGSQTTLFERADSCIVVQITNIRTGLQESMKKVRSSFTKVKQHPFQYLFKKVSIHCLDLLDLEKTRIDKLCETGEFCGCVIRSTHGLPCACHIWRCIIENVPLTLDVIHPFWQTLVIADGVEIPQCTSQGCTDQDEWNELVSRVNECDPAVVREVKEFMKRKISADNLDFEEPNVKGRPKGSHRI